MLLLSLLIPAFSLPTLISAKQFPMFNGVIGGVPPPGDVHYCKTTKKAFSNMNVSARTAGELRGVVEDSGICG